MPQVETFIQKYFPDAEYRSGEYCCRCPAHNDVKASLHVKQGDKPDGTGSTKIVMNCKAGCTNEEILEALGASLEEINGRDRKDAGTFFLRLSRRTLGEVTAIYDYRDQDDKYLYSKIRFRDPEGKKEIRFVRINYRFGSFEAGRGGLDPTLYQLPELIRSIEAGYPVYIVEGEKDVHTLRDQLHYRATTAGAAGDWKRDYAKYFKGAMVVILPDNDEPGRKAAEEIRHDLLEYAYQVKVVRVSDLPHGDVTDYLTEEAGTPETLKELISAEDWQPAVWLTVDKRDKHTINTDLLASCIDKNDKYLFVRGKSKDRDDLYIYEHGVYVKVNRNIFIARIIRPYVPKGRATANMLDNTMKLLLTSGSHSVKYTDLDQDENYINLKNGLLNINSWELEEHRPELLSTLQLDVEYRAGARRKESFDHYMKDLIRSPDGLEDPEKALVIQEYFGMLLSNIPMYNLKKILFLVSFIGNTGKSTLLRLIDTMLGEDHTAAIDLRELDGTKSSNRFTLGSMRGRRLIECGDQSSAVINDSSMFKQLTGGDKVKIEEKGVQQEYFRFTGGVVIASNQIPIFRDDYGNHLYERIQIIPLQHTILKKDTTLEKKMQREKSAIFNWFMEGLKRVRSNDYKLTECQSAAEFIQEYRTEGDSLYRYLTETYDITLNARDVVSKKEFDAAYHVWCAWINADPEQQERLIEVSRRQIRYRLESYGVSFKKNGKVDGRGGLHCYAGIKKKEVKSE